MKNKTTLTMVLTLLIATVLGCQFQCGSTPNSNSAATNSTNATAKPSEKPAEKPKTETANSNSEAPKTEPAKSADSTAKTTAVKFEKGKTSAEYENSIGNGDTQIYIVNVKKGQYLGAQTYSETDDDVAFTVRKKGGAELEVPEGSVKWGGDVPEDGDYEIVISNIKKTTKYSITISAE
jgi:hypothetical protein